MPLNIEDLSPQATGTTLKLGDLELNGSLAVTIDAVRTVGDGLLVADITVKDDEVGYDTLWLKGKFGPQNGALSLSKATDGEPEGKTCIVTKIPSDKSPAGYAFLWTHDA